MSRPDRDASAGPVGRAIYRLLLRAYPRSFRRRFGADMREDFDRMVGAARHRGWRGRLRMVRRLAVDWVRSVVRERWKSGSSRARPSRTGGPPPVLFELRQALRRIRAAPVFAAVVVLVLALGFGPTLAAYGIANELLFRPLPGVADPEELGIVWHGRALDGGGVTVGFISYLDLEEIAARAETLAGIAGVQGGGGSIVLESGAAQGVQVRQVTASYFSVLGLRPIAGRVFRDEEDHPRADAAGIGVVSHRMAVAMFGGPDRAVDERMRLSGEDIRIIGVLPAGFRGLQRHGQVDVWRPGAQRPKTGPGSREGNLRTDRSQAAFYEFVARLAPGATWEQARAELNGLNAWLAETWPEDNEGYSHHEFLVYPGVGLPALGRDDLTRTVWLIGAIALSVLAISCANAAGLLFLRSLARRGELAVQKALGASSSRLVRQILLDSALLCGFGTAVGLGLAAALLSLFQGTRLAGLHTPLQGIAIDWRVALFATVVSLVTAVLASFLATSETLHLHPARWITSSARTSTGRGRRWQAILGSLQIGVSVPLVVGSLLFGQTLWELARVDLGFDPTGVRVVSFDPSSPSLAGPDATRYLARLAERLEAQPQVESTAVAERFPFTCCGMRSRIQRPGHDGDPLDIRENAVTADYFEALDIPLVTGRTFEEGEVLDYEGQDFGVVILGASAATALFGDPSRALGQEVEFPYRARQGLTYRVVGVVGDVRVSDLTTPPPHIAYTPLGPTGLMMGARLVVRSAAGDGELLQTVTRTAASLEPGRSARPMEEMSSIGASIAGSLSERRMLATLFALLALVGLALAAVGLAASAARNVVARTREIGVRKALGADRADVLRAVLRDLVLVVILGGAAGTGLAAIGTRWLESRLYGVATGDPATWIATALVLGVVTLIAGTVPARRAVRIDPASALRHED